MAYITEKEINKKSPKGSWDNPIFMYDYLDSNRKNGHLLVAEYLGFKLKWDVTCDYKSWNSDKKHRAYPIFKLSHERYNIWSHNWNDLHRILIKIREDNLFDNDVKEALMSLNSDKVWEVIIKKITKYNKTKTKKTK